MTQDKMLKTVFTSQSDSIQQVIKRTCIVDYGVITKVLGKNIVRVGISVADSVEDVQVITCTLVTLCSTSLSVNIEASVGDKVLVVFPRHYNPKMFDVDNKDPIIDSTCKGYTRLAGLAFLVNQFDPDKHKRLLDITQETIKFTFNDNQLEINKDNEITVSNGKAEVKVDKNGNITVDAKTGKITLKNSSSSLYDILNGMLQILNTSLATAGSPASHTVVPNQFTTQSTQLGQLMQ